MKEYYVMSNAEKNDDIRSLVGSGAFLVEDLDHCSDFENHRFYQSYFDLNGILKMYLVTDFFYYFNFSIKKFVDNMYVVSKKFYSILIEFNIDLEKKVNLVVVDNNDLKRKLEDYLLVEFKSEKFNNILDLKKSFFYQEYPDTIDSIEKLYVNNNVKSNFILIYELRPQFKTPICSSEFKKRFDEMRLDGVNFFTIDNALWQNEDVLEFYFNEQFNESVENFVDPI